MAYAAVASLSETIHLIFNYHQDYTASQFQNQIKSLQKHSVFLQSFLEDDADRGNNWDETIREVADRAEEIVELLLSDSFLESIVGSSKSKLKEVDELQRVTEEIESIVNRVQGILTIGGSDDESTKLISRLRGGSSALEIIPIVGVEGVGKTTLATNAYNHPLIADHFQIRAWSTISSDYDESRVVDDLLRSIKVDDYLFNIEIRTFDETEILHTSLSGKRYLIVLDDVRNFEAWESLREMLPDDGNGSRIIITTRSFELASSAGCIHEVSLMDEDRSWNLFREKIFKGDPCPSQLECIGRRIARSCEGHRLCIEVVSRILAAADPTESAWEDISDNLKITSEADLRSRLVRILSVSYTYLPHRLRPCLLYLACFPDNQEIHVSKLIKLWVAEGFLNESEYKSSEEIGEERVEDLVMRGLVSVTKRKSNGRIKSMTVHDLMWEVCLRQAQIDYFMLHVGWIITGHIEAVELQSYRRVSTSTYDDDIVEGVHDSTIRTMFLSLEKGRVGVFSWSIGNVRLLRILDLSNANNYDLPEEVFGLFHLRYLAFNSMFSISEAISNLENLQTLIICPRENDDELFGKLPEGVWRMPQLRHVIVFPFELTGPKGVTTSALENLQTLSRVVDFICSRENLKMIPNLKKLSLLYTWNWRSEVENYGLDNLICMRELEILKIEIRLTNLRRGPKMSLCPFPPTLKRLTLCLLLLPWEDMRIVASLPNLQVLKLRTHAFVGERWVTSEGGFPQLTYLLIEESNLVHWITESDHFPTLKCLVLRSCWHLLRIPEDMAKIPSLERIELVDKDDGLLSRSANRIQKDRQSLGYDQLQIRLM